MYCMPSDEEDAEMDAVLREAFGGPSRNFTNVPSVRKRKAEVAGDYALPKRKPGKSVVKEKNAAEKENVGENESESVILDKKLLPLKPYLDEIEASDDLIKSLNKSKGDISVAFMGLIMKSFNDRDSCFEDNFKSSSDQTKRIRKQLLNKLIRARKIKEISRREVESKIKIMDCCLMKEKCGNVYHREFEADPNEWKPIELGGYVFGRGKNDDRYWRCSECVNHQRNLRVSGKPYELHGYLQRNPTTGKLEDKERVPRTNVDPEFPGGKPHVCGGKSANDAEMKVEKSEAAIKKRAPTIKEKMESFEKEIDELVKSADETSFSANLKNLMENFRGAFGFDSNHRRFFVYFITYSGEKNIMYYGITSNPTGRLYRHKLEIFSKDVKKRKVLQMHLIPLGTINMKFAGEFETAFIRLSKNHDLNEGTATNRNDSNGNYSKEDLLKPIIEAEDSREYNLLVKCLDELIQVTFAQGNSILSSDVSEGTRALANQMKRRFSGHVQIVKKAKESKPSSSSTISPLNFDKLPKELQEFLEKLKNTFKFMKGDKKYFIYFFTYKDEPGVIYYGITTNPNDRWDWHKRTSNGPLFEIFKQKKQLQMHVIPLGDIDCMLAAEVETMLIRLSKGGYLNDGNIAVNPTDGRYSSIYSFNEETVLSGDGEAFDALVKNLNSLIEATMGTKNFISK